MKISNSMIKRAYLKRMALKGQARDEATKYTRYINRAFDNLVYMSKDVPVITSGIVRVLKILLSLPYVRNNPKYNQIESVISSINSQLYEAYSITKKFDSKEFWWNDDSTRYRVETKIKNARNSFTNQLMPLIG